MEKIDVHAHILPERLPSFQEKFGYSGWIRLEHQSDSINENHSKLIYDDGTILRDVDERLYSIEARLKDMRRTGVTKQIISTVPVTFNYWAKGEDCEYVCRYLNDNISNVVRKYPNKFIGLGTVPMQNIELAINESKRCKYELGMKGLIIGTHINDKSYDDPVYEPFWRMAVDHHLPLFIHPWDFIKPKRWSKYWLPYVVGMTAETSATALILAFSGVFERYPTLKILLAHGGGTLPYINARANHVYAAYPKDVNLSLRKPNNYLKQNLNICADTLVHDSKALQLAINYFGENSLLLGSDFPFKLGEDVPGKMIDDHMNEFPSELKAKMFYENTNRFFNIE